MMPILSFTPGTLGIVAYRNTSASCSRCLCTAPVLAAMRSDRLDVSIGFCEQCVRAMLRVFRVAKSAKGARRADQG